MEKAAGAKVPSNADLQERLWRAHRYSKISMLSKGFKREERSMITRMSHVLIWVKNQQEALEFYRDKLGFEVDTDAMVGDDFR